MARQLIIPEPFRVAYREVEVPPPGAGQIKCRTVLTGISHGTEMTAYTGSSPFIARTFDNRLFRDKRAGDGDFYPFLWAGYDAVGVVSEIGRGVTRYKVGDRVWSNQRHQTEFLFDESFDETIVLSDRVRNEHAIMLNLTSIALTAINDAEIKLGDVVAIVGGGVVGQLAVQQAFASGARRVFLVEPMESRRTFASSKCPAEGIDPAAGTPAEQIRDANAGQWPDITIECSGAVAGLVSAIKIAGVGGTVVAAGFYQGPATPLVLGEEFLHNRVTLKASMGVWDCPLRYPRWDRPRLVREAYWLIESGRLNLQGFLTATFDFGDAAKAYEAIRSEPSKYLKVALSYA